MGAAHNQAPSDAGEPKAEIGDHPPAGDHPGQADDQASEHRKQEESENNDDSKAEDTQDGDATEGLKPQEEGSGRAKRVSKRPHKDYLEVVKAKEPSSNRKKVRQKVAAASPETSEAKAASAAAASTSTAQATTTTGGENTEAPVKKRGGGRKKLAATAAAAGSSSTSAAAAGKSKKGDEPDSGHEESLYHKVLVELGKTRPSHLITLTRAAIEHASNPTIVPLRDHLESAMASSGWNGDQCLRYLAAIQLACDSHDVGESRVAAAFQQASTAFSLLERFTLPNWAKEQQAAPSRSSIETTAFAIWATNLRASSTIPVSDSALLTTWETLDPAIRQQFESIAAHMQQMEVIARSTIATGRAVG